MNTLLGARHQYPTLYPVILFAVLFLFSTTRAEPLQVEVGVSSGGVRFIPPAGTTSLYVRVMSPDDVLVFDERTNGGSLYWSYNASDNPDGLYRYDCWATFDAGQGVQTRISPPEAQDISSHNSGVFTVRDGVLLLPQGQESLLSRVRRKVALLVTNLLDWAVTDVAAADLVASSVAPRVKFDDDLIGNSHEWEIETNGGYNDGDPTLDPIYQYFRIKDLIGTTETTVVNLKHSSQNNSSIVVDDNGDIHLANDGVFIDRSSGRLGLGNITPQYALDVYAHNAGIRLQNSGNSYWHWLLYSADNFLICSELDRCGFRVNINSPNGALVIDPSGNVGIGAREPDGLVPEAVAVKRAGDNVAARFQLTSETNTANAAPQFVQRRARQTGTTRSAIQASDQIGIFSFRGYDGAAYTGSKALIQVQAAEDWDAGNHATQMSFVLTDKDTDQLFSAMFLTSDGKVYINGSQLNVPDYVFEDDYKLMPLDELRVFIEKEKHLPDMPAEAEVKNRGVELGGTQMALLKKIEELTLYIINQHRKITHLENQNKDLRLEVERRLSVLEKNIINSRPD